jgi:hypothetical protein
VAYGAARPTTALTGSTGRDLEQTRDKPRCVGSANIRATETKFCAFAVAGREKISTVQCSPDNPIAGRSRVLAILLTARAARHFVPARSLS